MESALPTTDVVPLVELLGSFDAEGALFTTFTLSLSWFETYLLRHLERRGVRHILLLADPLGISDSLSEGLATGPGIRYVLEPVAAPRGAFHAKVALLWSKDRLLLAVGSGNLTFAGMQRNLEIWEVLSAGDQNIAPERLMSRFTGEALLGFLGALHERVDIGGRAHAVLSAAREVLTGWLPRLSENAAQVHWLDSTLQPIGDQIVSLAGPAIGHRRLQVLSPFYDGDGAAVRVLSQRLGASAIDLLYTNDTITFPVPVARLNGWPIVATRALTAGTGRPLHAKAFRLIDGTRSVLISGSANATWQALWTQGNIEACLLRTGTDFEWLLASTPGVPSVEVVPPVERTASPLTVRWARATGAHIAVQVHWSEEPSPDCATIKFLDGFEAASKFPWPTDGRFLLPLPGDCDPLRPRAMRLEVLVQISAEIFRARAWVAFDDFLDASPTNRAALHAWSRLLEHESLVPDEEDAMLLRMFAEEHARTLSWLSESTRKARRPAIDREPGDVETEDRPIPLDLLDAMARAPAVLPPEALVTPGTGDFVERVRIAMLSALRAIDTHDHLSVTADALGDDEFAGKKKDKGRGDQPPPLSRTVRDALEQFEETFLGAARDMRVPPAQPDSVLAYLVFCGRLLLRYRLRDGENRDGFWQSANAIVRAFLVPRSEREQGPLLSMLASSKQPAPPEAIHLLTFLVTLLEWRARGNRLLGDDDSTGADLLHGDGLREALACLDRGADVVPVAVQLPASVAAIFPAELGELDHVLKTLRRTEAPSTRALLLKMEADRAGRHESNAHRERSHNEDEVLRFAKRGRAPLAVAPWIDTCPRCRQCLATALLKGLLRRQPVQCSNSSCARWLIPSEGT